MYIYWHYVAYNSHVKSVLVPIQDPYNIVPGHSLAGGCFTYYCSFERSLGNTVSGANQTIPLHY